MATMTKTTIRRRLHRRRQQQLSVCFPIHYQLQQGYFATCVMATRDAVAKTDDALYSRHLL